MSVQLRSRVHAVLANLCETGRWRDLPLDSWLSRGALAAASLAAVSFIDIPTASAVPSYARQTGQPCATCHTAFPELTPYGRQFKLMGYTAGGTRCNDGSAKSDETQVPLALMSLPRHVHRRQELGQPGRHAGAASNISNDAWYPGQQSIFVAGQLYCDVGAFAQVTYDPVGNAFTWDNVDIRYAKTGVISGTSVVYGITANNNPTVQDVWNTVPAWVFPYMDTAVGPAPAYRHHAREQAPTASKSAVSAPMSGSTAASMRNFRRLWQPVPADAHQFERRIRSRRDRGWTDRPPIGGWPTKRPGTRTR